MLKHDIDNYDPDVDDNKEHYLQGLENLDLNMQISEMPIAIWCTNSAHEVYNELSARSTIRGRANELREKKF